MFNEEAGAEVCVKSVCMELDRLPGRSALLVVNDGSRDRTDEILHRLAPAHLKLKVITHPANRGYGRALRSGVGEAARCGYDYVLFMDSDLTNDPANIPRFFAEMARGWTSSKRPGFLAPPPLVLTVASFSTGAARSCRLPLSLHRELSRAVENCHRRPIEASTEHSPHHPPSQPATTSRRRHPRLDVDPAPLADSEVEPDDRHSAFDLGAVGHPPKSCLSKSCRPRERRVC